jgi:hypothetical protein
MIVGGISVIVKALNLLNTHPMKMGTIRMKEKTNGAQPRRHIFDI